MTEILLKLNERHHLRCFSPFNQNYQTRFRRNWLHKLLLTSSRISFSSACASASSFSLCFVKVCNFRASSFWTALVPIGGLDRIFAFSAFRKKYSEPQYVFCWTLINFVPKKKKKKIHLGLEELFVLLQGCESLFGALDQFRNCRFNFISNIGFVSPDCILVHQQEYLIRRKKTRLSKKY